MLYSELYRRAAAVRQASTADEDALVQKTLVRDVLSGEFPAVDVHYHIPPELQQTADEFVEPDFFEVLTHSVVEDTAGRFTVFVEAAYETIEPVVNAVNRPITPADFETVTVVYHLRANLTPVMGKVQAKVFVAFEPLHEDED